MEYNIYMLKPSKTQTIIIEPKKKFLYTNWKELLSYLDLFYFLTWRNIKIRYKQTALGIIWIVLQPLLSYLLD